MHDHKFKELIENICLITKNEDMKKVFETLGGKDSKDNKDRRKEEYRSNDPVVYFDANKMEDNDNSRPLLEELLDD